MSDELVMRTYLVKLMTGEWLVSEAASSGDVVYLRNPLVLAQVKTDEGMASRFVPYIPANEVNTISIKHEHMFTKAELTQDMKLYQSYHQVFSPVEVVEKPEIVTP